MDLKNVEVDELFDASEMPGSQLAYYRELEIKRRQFALSSDLAQVQTRAAEKQILAADAVVTNAAWVRRSAISVIIATTVTVLTFLADFLLR